MKLFIPSLGTKIKLLSVWKFKLYYEDRNHSLLQQQGFIPEDASRYSVYWRKGNDMSVSTFLPKGTELKIDRIYIRKGSKNFDSITFFIINGKEIGYKGTVRFWVKLHDANEIDCEII